MERRRIFPHEGKACCCLYLLTALRHYPSTVGLGQMLCRRETTAVRRGEGRFFHAFTTTMGEKFKSDF